MLGRDAKVELLKRVPLFARLSKAELRRLARVVDEFDVREGRMLTEQGARGREFIAIVEGTAIVKRNGRRVNRLGPGDFFGEIALVTGAPRTATVTAETSVHALVLTDREFRRLLKSAPTVTLKVLEALGRRLAAEDV